MFHRQQGQISPKSSKVSQKGQQTTTKRANDAHSVVQRAQANPSSLNADDVLTLQGTIGNRAANRLLAGQSATQVQAKLTIGQPGDKYEQEADRVASQVVEQLHAPASAESAQGQSVQRQDIDDDELQAKHEMKALQRQDIDDDELQAKPSSSDQKRVPLSPEVQREAMLEDDDLQAKSILQRQEGVAVGEASTDLESAINRARGSGQPLDAGLQQSMGQAMGADFSGVKVHTDAQSDQLNQSIQAKAFTTGQDMFFRQGEYNPGNRGGQELIAHELTHVVQQNGFRVQKIDRCMGIGLSVPRKGKGLGKKNSLNEASPLQSRVIQQREVTGVIQRDACLFPRTPNSPYYNIPQQGNVGPGEGFDANQRFAILNANFRGLGPITNVIGPGTQFEIQQDDSNQQQLLDPKELKPSIAEVDHIVPQDQGGCNSELNAQVLSGTRNASKGNTYPWGGFTGYKIFDPGTGTESATQAAAQANGADLTTLQNTYPGYLGLVPP